MLDETGCDLVMIGRGAMGRPWVFRVAENYISTGSKIEEPSYEKRVEVCLEHYALALELLDTERAVKEMRKHIGWYIKGMPNCTQIRSIVFQMTDPDEVIRTLTHYAQTLL